MLIRTLFLILLASLFYNCSPKEDTHKKSWEMPNVNVGLTNELGIDTINFLHITDSIVANLAEPAASYFKYNRYRFFYQNIKSNYTKSLLYVDSMIWVTAKEEEITESLRWQAGAYVHQGWIFIGLKFYDKAIESFFNAKNVALQTKDSCFIISAIEMLPSISFKAGKYVEAIEYYHQVFDAIEHCYLKSGEENFFLRQAILDNIALCYTRLARYDSAVYYYDSALNYIDHFLFVNDRLNSAQKKWIDKSFIESARGVIYGNKGGVLLSLGDSVAAEKLLKESIRLNILPNHAMEDVPSALYKLCILLIGQDRLSEAKKMMMQFRHFMGKTPNNETRILWYRLQAEYRKRKNDPKGIYDALTNYINVLDSTNKAERTLFQTNIKSLFNHYSTQQTLIELQETNILRNLYMALVTAALLLTTIFILFIYKNLKQSKKYTAELKGLNDNVRLQKNNLEQAYVALKESQETNNRMLQIVVHDLRTPVTTILGLSELLVMETNHSPKQLEMLKMINKSSINSMELIKEILNVNISIPVIHKTPLAIQEVLQYCTDLLQLKAKEKRQRINLIMVDVWVVGNKEKLWRVFSNLITNAIKFSPEDANITINSIVQNKEVIISFQDEGIGIPEKFKDHLFQMSPLIRRRGTGGEPSFGLGLAICEQIIEAHEGRIWYESEENSGSIFYVSLPLKTSNV